MTLFLAIRQVRVGMSEGPNFAFSFVVSFGTNEFFTEITTKLKSMNDAATQVWNAAIERKLHKVPKALLTLENLTAVGEQGVTALLLASSNGQLEQVPSGFFTEETVRASVFGKTILHGAAIHGQLSLIPNALLTAENLSACDDQGVTPLYEAAWHRRLEQIPVAILWQFKDLQVCNDGRKLATYFSPELKELVDRYADGSGQQV